MKEIDYHPNMFAIGLAAKKVSDSLFDPRPSGRRLRHSVAQGIEKATIELRPFNVSVEFIYYVHTHESSYSKGCDALRNMEIDAALMAPNFEKETTELAAVLQTRKVPYIFVDLNIEGARALKYIRQDSHMSGFTCCQIADAELSGRAEAGSFLSEWKDNPAEIQMIRHMEGFMVHQRKFSASKSAWILFWTKTIQPQITEALENFFKNHRMQSWALCLTQSLPSR